MCLTPAATPISMASLLALLRAHRQHPKAMLPLLARGSSGQCRWLLPRKIRWLPRLRCALTNMFLVLRTNVELALSTHLAPGGARL